MKKVKKKSILILVFTVFILVLTSTNSVNAISYEGETNINSGGLCSYAKWFEDFSGVLIVTSTFRNASGIEFADITLMVVCRDPDTTFRLRVWDSDTESFLNSEREVGQGVYERRISVMAHKDQDKLIWIASATSENGLTLYAKITLVYFYDPEAMYEPIQRDADPLSEQDYKLEILYTNIAYIVNIFLVIIFTGALAIQREGIGVKSFLKNKIKGEPN